MLRGKAQKVVQPDNIGDNRADGIIRIRHRMGIARRVEYIIHGHSAVTMHPACTVQGTREPLPVIDIAPDKGKTRILPVFFKTSLRLFLIPPQRNDPAARKRLFPRIPLFHPAVSPHQHIDQRASDHASSTGDHDALSIQLLPWKVKSADGIKIRQIYLIFQQTHSSSCPDRQPPPDISFL